MSRSAPALRPYLPDDAPLLAAIFAASIMDLTGDDYSEAQQEAWAAAADDEAAFGKKLAGQLTLIATLCIRVRSGRVSVPRCAMHWKRSQAPAAPRS